MRLRIIAEIQRKWPTTNMDRTNVTGVYGTASMNDFYHLVHPNGQGHGQKRKAKKDPPQDK